MDYNQNQKDLFTTDADVYAIIQEETRRQHTKLEMIASENFTSSAVIEATGSLLTNKYAEGYPGNRYYGGCEVVDKVETLAIERAKELFNAEYANVQAHSGSSANMAVYVGFLNAGDTIVGMDLAHGGHLTHGAHVSFSGKNYRAVSYGVHKETELLDFDEIETIVKQHKPKLIIAGASAYSRVIDFEKFAAIAHKYDALLMVDMAHIAGLVATKQHPSPIPHADVVTTTTHKTLRGPRGGLIIAGKDKENTLGLTTASGKTKKYSQILNSAMMPGIQGGPLMHVIAAKAVALKECMEKEFVIYQKQVIKNANALATALINGGIRIVSGGTDNHLFIADVRNFGITGKEAERYLDDANISANKNAIPFDPQPPFVTSGVRFGTPALTSRGMDENDMQSVASFIIEVLKSNGKTSTLSKVAHAVQEFTNKFPMRKEGF